MREKGYALVWVMVVSLPLLFMSGALLELVFMDCRMNINVAGKQQAYNNAEAGLLDVRGRLAAIDFSIGTTKTYWLGYAEDAWDFSDVKPDAADHVKVVVTAWLLKNPVQYNVNVEGSHDGLMIPLSTVYYGQKR